MSFTGLPIESQLHGLSAAFYALRCAAHGKRIADQECSPQEMTVSVKSTIGSYLASEEDL